MSYHLVCMYVAYPASLFKYMQYEYHPQSSGNIWKLSRHIASSFVLSSGKISASHFTYSCPQVYATCAQDTTHTPEPPSVPRPPSGTQRLHQLLTRPTLFMTKYPVRRRNDSRQAPYNAQVYCVFMSFVTHILSMYSTWRVSRGSTRPFALPLCLYSGTVCAYFFRLEINHDSYFQFIYSLPSSEKIHMFLI